MCFTQLTAMLQYDLPPPAYCMSPLSVHCYYYYQLNNVSSSSFLFSDDQAIH